MTDRGPLPDALFIRHPEAERDQELPLVGLLFLLAPMADPEALARRLAPQLTSPDDLPLDGAVVALWATLENAWPC